MKIFHDNRLCYQAESEFLAFCNKQGFKTVKNEFNSRLLIAATPLVGTAVYDLAEGPAKSIFLNGASEGSFLFKTMPYLTETIDFNNLTYNYAEQ